ncbi:hypothetical protein MP228_008583 [Amoeboaphelidium protococcarum]|nr:hypothetical protein MP228_008583 [Amoeboaphelidium protococcarum]
MFLWYQLILSCLLMMHLVNANYNEMQRCKGFAEYLQSRRFIRYLASGSYARVYQISDGTVIKTPSSELAGAQIEKEVLISHELSDLLDAGYIRGVVQFYYAMYCPTTTILLPSESNYYLQMEKLEKPMVSYLASLSASFQVFETSRSFLLQILSTLYVANQLTGFVMLDTNPANLMIKSAYDRRRHFDSLSIVVSDFDSFLIPLSASNWQMVKMIDFGHAQIIHDGIIVQSGEIWHSGIYYQDVNARFAVFAVLSVLPIDALLSLRQTASEQYQQLDDIAKYVLQYHMKAYKSCWISADNLISFVSSIQQNEMKQACVRESLLDQPLYQSLSWTKLFNQAIFSELRSHDKNKNDAQAISYANIYGHNNNNNDGEMNQ